jgi:hypothetical protein
MQFLTGQFWKKKLKHYCNTINFFFINNYSSFTIKLICYTFEIDCVRNCPTRPYSRKETTYYDYVLWTFTNYKFDRICSIMKAFFVLLEIKCMLILYLTHTDNTRCSMVFYQIY